MIGNSGFDIRGNHSRFAQHDGSKDCNILQQTRNPHAATAKGISELQKLGKELLGESWANGGESPGFFSRRWATLVCTYLYFFVLM